MLNKYFFFTLDFFIHKLINPLLIDNINFLFFLIILLSINKLKSLYYKKMALSSPLTVVGLMNGMIGGVILVLPVTAYQAGYLFTILAILFSGFFSFYSCYLSIKHLGDQKDMNFAMQAHFNSKVAMIFYDIVVWLGLLLGSIFYF